MSKYPGRVVTDLAPAGYSVYFDGSGDRIQTASNAALALGTNDFSIEWWERRDVIGSDDTPVTTGDYSSAYASCLLGYSGTAGYISTTGSGWNVFNGPAYVDTVLAGVWNHFVYTRSGTAFRVFMNGKLSNYVTGSGSVVQNNNRFNVGGNSGGAQYDFPGYISNFRVVIGSIPTQYQTSSTTVGTQIFTPPTQLSLVTNTVLLACNSPSIIDQSSNNIAFTVTGNALVSTVTPFTAYVPYNPALGASTPGVWTLDEALQAKGTRQWNMYDPHFNLTTLLLRSGSVDGSQNNQFLDSSNNNFTITRNPTSGPNAPTQGTFSPFSQTGWSFNFNRGYISSTLTGQAAGTGSFTYELFFWINVKDAAVSNVAALFSTRTGGTGADGIDCQITSTGQVQVGTSAAILFTSSAGLVSDNTWYHLAIVRNGSTNCTVYLNGLSIGTYTAAANYSSTSLVLGIFGGVNDWFKGFISNFRYTRDAVYTSNFTVPASPLTPITNTQFLTAQSNRYLDTSANGFTITPVVANGGTSIQAFSPFYPTVAYTPATVGGSGYFDASGDYLSVAGSSLFAFGTGDFTLEVWINPNAISTATFDRVCATSDYNGSGFDWTLNTGASALFLAGSSYGFSVNTKAWNHLVYTRSGTTLRGFLNGRLASYNTGVSQNISSTSTLLIGAGYSGALYNGYMTGLRIIKGSIPTEYQTSSTTTGTQIFTTPTAPPTTTSQGATANDVELLLNFTNAAITDATSKSVLETVGNAQASTSVRNTRLVTTPPTSMYFDGTGDYLQTAPNQLFSLGASNFTIEFWIYPTSFASVTYPMYSATARSKSDVLAFEVGTAGTIVAYVTASGGAAWSIVSAGNVGTLTLNTWNHVAFVRNGSAFRGYVNGVQGGMTTSSSSAVASFDGWNIGFNGVSGFFTGYMDDIRITRVARYTGPFTPPRSRLQEQ